MHGRYIKHLPGMGSWNMAVDYALLRSTASSGVPALRLYRWEHPAVTIGYFQVVDDEIDVAQCRNNGVDIIRRITGGGAVYHDRELTYSITLPLTAPGLEGPVTSSYEFLTTPIVEALAAFGVPACFAPVNDILAGGKKISGSAQTRREGALLQHGTILISLDRERMFSCLKVPAAKRQNSGPDEPGKRVIALDEIIGEAATSPDFIDKLSDLLRDGFSRVCGIDFVEWDITSDEREDARALEAEFFRNEAYIYKRKNLIFYIHCTIVAIE